MPVSAGIPTRYAGMLMRSRLEARWAAFFDLISWEWEYEPIDGNGYIPDFLVRGREPLLVEVKPAFGQADYEAPVDKVERGLRGHWRRDLLILGGSWCTPELRLDWTDQYPVAGLLGQHDLLDDDSGEWAWCETGWVTCGRCGAYGVFHTVQRFSVRPCGHHLYDDDALFGEPEWLPELWAEAGDTVRWQRAAL